MNTTATPTSSGGGGGGGGVAIPITSQSITDNSSSTNSDKFGAGGNGSGAKEVHSLALKVMRLSKPSFVVFIPQPSETDEIINYHQHKGLQQSTQERDDEHQPFGLSEMLTLPHSFGNIYLGETFSSYISVHNQSPFDVKNVTVKSELQTSTQRFNLLDLSSTPLAVFASGESHDYVVQHEIKEGGIHILVCTVNYVKHDGEKKYFRKFFRFQVMNPISIKTQTHDLQTGTFLSAQIKNVAQSPLYLESVKFEPMPLFSLQDLNVTTESTSSTKLNSALDFTFLKSGDVRQFLFKLEPKNPSDPRIKTASVIGKMDIIWKANLGEMGRLQTAALERKLPNQVEVELQIRKIPQHIILERPFTVQCEIINRSDRIILPRVVFLKSAMNGIMANGISGQIAGNSKLPSGSSHSIPLTFFPIKPGVHKITGLRVIDDLSQKTYDFSDITDVFVET